MWPTYFSLEGQESFSYISEKLENTVHHCNTVEDYWIIGLIHVESEDNDNSRWVAQLVCSSRIKLESGDILKTNKIYSRISIWMS